MKLERRTVKNKISLHPTIKNRLRKSKVFTGGAKRKRRLYNRKQRGGALVDKLSNPEQFALLKELIGLSVGYENIGLGDLLGVFVKDELLELGKILEKKPDGPANNIISIIHGAYNSALKAKQALSAAADAAAKAAADAEAKAAYAKAKAAADAAFAAAVEAAAKADAEAVDAAAAEAAAKAGAEAKAGEGADAGAGAEADAAAEKIKKLYNRIVQKIEIKKNYYKEDDNYIKYLRIKKVCENNNIELGEIEAFAQAQGETDYIKDILLQEAEAAKSSYDLANANLILTEAQGKADGAQQSQEYKDTITAAETALKTAETELKIAEKNLNIKNTFYTLKKLGIEFTDLNSLKSNLIDELIN